MKPEDYEYLAHIVTIGYDKIHFALEGIVHNKTREHALYYNLSDMGIKDLIDDPLIRASSLIYIDEFVNP